jgi:hypothetical protein
MISVTPTRKGNVENSSSFFLSSTEEEYFCIECLKYYIVTHLISMETHTCQ